MPATEQQIQDPYAKCCVSLFLLNQGFSLLPDSLVIRGFPLTQETQIQSTPFLEFKSHFFQPLKKKPTGVSFQF